MMSLDGKLHNSDIKNTSIYENLCLEGDSIQPKAWCGLCVCVCLSEHAGLFGS